MLDIIIEKLSHLPPEYRQPVGDDRIREAAVLIPVTRARDPSLVFIKRASHMSSHSGQVAFPGGMWEPEDDSLLHTALRESHEEIALEPEDVEVIAALPVRATRFNVRVSPYIGFIPEGLPLVPDPSEVESVFQVPLSFLANAGNLTHTEYKFDGGLHRVPCYFYQGYCIWGFTLHVLAEMLKYTSGLELALKYTPIGEITDVRP